MRQRLSSIRLFIMVIVCMMALNAVAKSNPKEEQWLNKGTEFYFDGQQDSAKVYLEQVFLTDTDEKMTAARYLLDIAIAQGDTPKINEYALFLADNTTFPLTKNGSMPASDTCLSVQEPCWGFW